MSNILTGFNMQGNDPIDNRIVSPSKFETLEEYLQRVPIQKRYYGLSFYALDENNELRHYTFQTSLIEPTIDDDEEEIERLDKELQEHVKNKEIHKTSEEIRSEIVDADIPDTIARVQWTLDKIEEAVNTVMGDIVDGASDEYNTLKKIQDKIVELRTEVESQLYGDDGGEVLKTLEQALKFLNQYKDFIVDIPDNYVNKQDIVDNLNTDDPTKVLSARQGKVLSETLTNYFDSVMASIRAETNRAINAENRIETKLDKEIDRSIKEDQRIDAKLDAEIKRSTDEDLRIDSKLDAEIERSTNEDIRIDNKLDSEINRSTAEDDRLDQKIDAETTRATTAESNLNTKIETETDRAEGEESRIEAKLDNEITRSTNKDTEHDNRLQALEGQTHEQNTDLGTTNSTFQLKYNTGNKIKHESDAISVRNAADTDYVNFIAKNATFKGDLLVEGQSFVTEAETVEIKDNLLLLNKGEVGAGVTKGIAGLEIDRGTEPNYQIIFDESDNRFKAGEIGDIQCLALRDEDGDMLDGMFTTWDSATHRLKTTNIIPSTRKLFFNTNANSLGYTSHVYDSTYTADSFTFTKEAGSLFFSAGTTNLNLDTDKTYFRFYKNLMIPSSIISSGTSISLLNASGATIATFGSPSTINSSLNVANQVIIKGGSNTKLILQSSDADNFNLIESQNSSGTILSKLGYYGTFWGIDNKKIATEEFANNKFLPLAGGTMTGVILMNNNVVIQSKNSSGTAKRLIGKGSNNVTYIGDSDGHTFLYSDAADISHIRNGTSYIIWDSYNLTNPVTYTTDTYNYATLRNKDGQYFTYIKAGTSGLLPHSKATLVSGGSGSLGTSDQSFNAAYINNLHTNKVTFGDAGSFIDNQSGGSNHKGIGFYTSQNAACPVYVGNLYVSDSYANSSPNMPTNGIYSKGHIRTGSAILFLNNTWTNDLAPNRNSAGYLQVLDAYAASSAGGPTNYGTVLQVNSRDAHWANQLWFPGGADSSKNGLYYRHMAYNKTTYGNWIKLATTSDISNYLPLTGGTLNGALTINGPNTLYHCTLNSSYTRETVLSVQRKGIYKAAFGYYDGIGAFLYNYPSAKYLFVDDNGDARVGTTNGSTKLALITDIPTVSGYLPLSGGTMSGFITFPNSAGIVQNVKETSNYVRLINWVKGTKHYSGQIGYHSTGGDGNGAIIIRPYYDEANAWSTAKGLYISKGQLLIDGASVATQTWVSSQGFLKTAPSITISNSGSGNAVTAITASGHTLTVTKGATYLTSSSLSGYATQSWVTSQGYLTSSSLSGYATQTWVNNKGYLTSHQTIYNLTFQAGTFSAKTFDPNGAAATVNIPTSTSHLTNNSGFITSSALSGYATQSWANSQFASLALYNTTRGYSTIRTTGNEVCLGNTAATSASNQMLVNYRIPSGCTYAPTSWAWRAGSSSSYAAGYWGNLYMNDNLVATQSWASGQFLTKTGIGASGTWDISITGNAATATTASNSNNLGGYAAATYVKSTSTTKVSDIQVVTTAGSTTGVLYIVLED